jgi:hypothetical protein
MSQPSDARLLVLLGLRLKGFAGPDAVSEVTGLDSDAVTGELERATADELVMYRDGAHVSGYALTPAGRTHGEALLAAELDGTGTRGVVAGAYERFMHLNGDMLQLCTDWQVRELDGEQVLNDHGDADYDAEVLARLVDVDDSLAAVLGSLGSALSRYQPYRSRFSSALEKLLAGDRDYFTKPIIASYHTVWFELHEDLLASLGIDRASEGST